MSDRILVGTRKGLFMFARPSGATPSWQLEAVHFLGDPVTMVLRDPRDGTYHAALNMGHFGVKMRRSHDGRTWQESPVPVYPPQPEGHQGTPWSLIQVWSLEPGGADERGVLWAGTLPGGLFRSRDSGDTWELIRSLWDRPERGEWFGGGADHPGIHSICVDPRDARRIKVAVSCGGIWESADGGESWGLASHGMEAEYMPPERRADPNVQDVHRLTQCRTHPDVLWVQHHGGIYRSSDAAASWRPIEAARPSAFGFAVAVHPADPDLAWFVPADKDQRRVPLDARFVVSRTRDGGESFDVLSEGLPREPAYDLVFRHGLDVDDSGERLAMGSTTGGLWVSENQGETWQCLSARLPPIYCVRFC